MREIFTSDVSLKKYSEELIHNFNLKYEYVLKINYPFL